MRDKKVMAIVQCEKCEKLYECGCDEDGKTDNGGCEYCFETETCDHNPWLCDKCYKEAHKDDVSISIPQIGRKYWVYTCHPKPEGDLIVSAGSMVETTWKKLEYLGRNKDGEIQWREIE